MEAKSKRIIANNRFILAMTLPCILMMITFVFIPLVMGLRISFTNWNGYSQNYRYIGLQNYVKLFSDKMFKQAFINTLIYGFGSTFFQTLLGIAYALLLNKSFYMKNATRSIVYLPAMIASLMVGYVWSFMVEYSHGALNDILLLLGFNKLDWMGVGTRAVWIITAINTLTFCGKAMVIYVAGLNSIPSSYYEAASMDGAGSVACFRHITLPQLIPAIMTSTILNLIGGLKLFGLIEALTGGGPGYSTHSLSTLINSMYFAYQNAGYASAIGVVTFVFIMLVNILLRSYLMKKEAEAQ